MGSTSGAPASTIWPGDPRYDPARTVWNAMVDRRPAAIVPCTTPAQVAEAIRYAREQALEIGIRCGGHSVIGHAVPDDGLTIDLTPMNAVRVDAARRRAWVQGGALLGRLDVASQQYGLATTAGNVSHTGVGGLTLGGGMGWLARQYGLSCDNVVAFEVVTATGDVVHASAEEHPDLFWALRGGGGNFGVVTDFEFVLHEVPGDALTVEIDFPLASGGDVLRGWRKLNETAPRSATFAASVSNDVLTVGYVWVGDPEQGRRLAPSIRALGTPLAERVQDWSYVELQRREDTERGHAFRRYWKGHYFSEFTDTVIDTMVAAIQRDWAPGVSLQAHGGAIAEVPDEETAFSHRDTVIEMVAGARWTEPTEDESRISSARAFAAELESHASGMYVNVLADEDPRAVRRAYSAAKLARLTAVKDSYDPENVFHLNANIKPSGSA